MCANICECLRVKCWQRQKMQEITLVVEGQVAMLDDLQSSLYICFKIVCYSLP